jgi:predicted DNA-binding transcriptional regulator AlpA
MASGKFESMNAEPYLTRAELAAHLKIGRTTICELEKLGLPRHTWGQRIVRYRASEVEIWLEQA